MQPGVIDRIYCNANLKLLDLIQRGALFLIVRSIKLTPMIQLEAEPGILPIDIRLQECSRM